MKEILISFGFILFATVILIVLTMQQMYGVNLMDGISWPRFTTTRERRSSHKTRSIKSVNKTKSPRVKEAVIRRKPEVDLQRPKTYKGNRSKFETMVYRAIESMFPQIGFRTVRPKFNMGAKGRALEFDAYSHCFRLSIEAHGIQHYEFTSAFQDTIKDFYDQQDRDRMTRENASAAGLTHLEIPYTCKTEEEVIDYLCVLFDKIGGYEPVFYCDEGCTHDVECRITGIEL